MDSSKACASQSFTGGFLHVTPCAIREKKEFASVLSQEALG
ncbi:hypothetical protein CLOSTMETH_00512 [[Clostridium] methylpentosum DSM 5476]|uniref:Uncharacterized protein n=1 Tax=[Clostridium] methylpentosum DSM 5476 TaxID=537013 RepID=C0E9L3_9FIRM|nr:hypothetical protein CLOSTMETH_00512 [[Clostridium] methylpentosum DSM 5476]